MEAQIGAQGMKPLRGRQKEKVKRQKAKPTAGRQAILTTKSIFLTTKGTKSTEESPKYEKHEGHISHHEEHEEDEGKP